MGNLLQQGIEVFQSGKKEEARKLFISFIRANPESESGWRWLYCVSRTDRERIHCLQQIVKINPGDKKAKQLLDRWLGSPSRGPAQKSNIAILGTSAVATMITTGFCVLLAAFSIRVVSYNGHCLFLSLNVRDFCYPSQRVTQAEVRSAAPLTIVSPTAEAPVSSATPVIPLTPTLALTPTILPTGTASPAPQATFASPGAAPWMVDLRLEPSEWRKWPVVPELSVHAQEILRLALRNSALDPHTFSKVGDCQMVAGTFLGGYADGTYSMPQGMDATVQWFSASMVTDNMTAVNGYGINTVLNLAFALPAGYQQCRQDETPLDCELRTRRPMIVMIGMGTNWIPNGEVSFEKYLREIVDSVLATGALPILATKADNVEGNWKLNEAIARVAYDYDLPLVNVWRAVQDLPNHGLEKPPRQVYLTGDGWMKRNHAWLVTLDKVRKIMFE
jgi:hypothetical protein